MIMTAEIEAIAKKISRRFRPTAIYLFGSYAKGTIRRNSDIDLCLVIDVDDKRALKRRIHMEIEQEVDLDIVIYTPQQWEKYKNDPARFANIIYREGVNLSGRFH
ncbi:nucleotidyltransferase domain-containing protein [Anoxynatronum sibiricum]|uniref:Nucleotidyltransferase domain-containing protein n=1 Tax=Anoxynatronum sibiricum TaxID=210623 RepID=A0ABU9VT39_9CLOT